MPALAKEMRNGSHRNALPKNLRNLSRQNGQILRPSASGDVGIGERVKMAWLIIARDPLESRFEWTHRKIQFAYMDCCHRLIDINSLLWGQVRKYCGGTKALSD
jgi:hypothetical protein